MQGGNTVSDIHIGELYLCSPERGNPDKRIVGVCSAIDRHKGYAFVIGRDGVERRVNCDFMVSTQKRYTKCI